MLIGQQRKGIIFIKTAIEITNVLKEIPFTTLEITEDVTRVAKKLIEMGILTQKSFDDCQHIGVAVINECDCIISWNFKRIVNVKTISFTIEDIHKIREYHYELTKNMTTQEKINFYNEGGKAFLAEMEKRKLQKSQI